MGVEEARAADRLHRDAAHRETQRREAERLAREPRQGHQPHCQCDACKRERADLKSRRATLIVADAYATQAVEPARCPTCGGVLHE